MKICKHGDVMLFVCKECGCTFVEAVKKTSLDSCGVWSSEHDDHGTWMDCPDCGNSVLGFREEKKNKHQLATD